MPLVCLTSAQISLKASFTNCKEISANLKRSGVRRMVPYKGKQAAKFIFLQVLPGVVILVLPLKGSQVINLLPAGRSACSGIV